MVIIFDYDHTVFDMMAMHDDLVKAMRDVGISERVYHDAYAQVTNWKMFTAEALSNRLNRLTGIAADKIRNALESVAGSSGKHVYPDTAAGFKALKDQGHDLYILSWGDKSWQMKKINASGLLPFCKEVLSVSQLKADYLKTWAPPDARIVLVDDKPAELKAVQESGQGISLIRMRRPGAKYSDQDTPDGLAEASDMQDILRMVDSMK